MQQMTVGLRRNRRHFISTAALCVLSIVAVFSVQAQHAFVVVIDGARYQETFASMSTNIPHMWNELRHEGTVYSDFRNDGKTVTCPGHSALITGNWQDIKNDGSQHPLSSTVFEWYRKQTGAPPQSCFVVAGKKKLDMLTYGRDTAYGPTYGADFVSQNEEEDTRTITSVFDVMDTYHPRMVIVNLAETDVRGHADDWRGYLQAISDADSLIAMLWKKIQSDSIYRNTTTLFVTNDHGRHDDDHGGFKDHGCSCEGCRHIMLLAIGPGFEKGALLSERAYQIDVAPSIGQLFGLVVPPVIGKSLLRSK